MTTDYKKFYRRCREVYPFVTEHLAPTGDLHDMRKMPAVFESFSAITGHTRDDLTQNIDDSRMVFIAVAVKMSDSLFFEFNDYAPYRLLLAISKISGCSKGQILYNLKKVKNYWQVYPDFRKKVNDICTKIKVE
ncbi:MAG TPA: hypothetical protein PLD74_12970 [Prolixibacteraceae bacterium]|nr:hypothetical protein [Prolixibacteraceae bacterium]